MSIQEAPQPGQESTSGGGWIKLPRNFENHPIFTDYSPSVWKLFTWWLWQARWQDGDWNHGQGTVHLKRGTFLTSYRRMAKATGLTEKAVRHACGVLVRAHFGALERAQVGAQVYTLVTITNYDLYQGTEGHALGHALGHGSGSGWGTALIEEGKKEEVKKDSDSDARTDFPQLKTTIEAALGSTLTDVEFGRVVEVCTGVSDAELAKAVELAIERSPGEPRSVKWFASVVANHRDYLDSLTIGRDREADRHFPIGGADAFWQRMEDPMYVVGIMERGRRAMRAA